MELEGVTLAAAPDLLAEVERLRAELIEVRELLGRQRDACNSAVGQLLAAQRRNEDLQTRLDFYDRQAETETAAQRDALADALVPLAALSPYYLDTEESGPVFISTGRAGVTVKVTGADVHRAVAALRAAGRLPEGEPHD